MNRRDPIPLSTLDREDAEHHKNLEKGRIETNNAVRQSIISKAYADGQFGLLADEVDSFLADFAELCGKTRTRVGSQAPDGFDQMLEEHDVDEQDLMYLALLLIQNRKSADDRYWGSKLIFALSASGIAEATIRIVSNAFIQAKNEPGLLKGASVAIERGRLQKIAREQQHSRAMVLEGKIAYLLGDADTAIKWWWQAVEKAEAKGKEDLARVAAGVVRDSYDLAGMDRSDLSTPWNELIEAHFERSLKQGKNEWELCEKAIKIGMDQSDPTAYYYAATYYMKRNEDGGHMPTSEWLYYMTKSASSGVGKAAYALGVYYAESGWKYIEDEPPEHLKPTPFDSYPAEEVKPSSLWDLVRKMFLPSIAKDTDDKDDIFHTAAWPSTPEDRYKLAHYWLNLACRHTYAPAFLYKAKLAMQETLWAGAQAPQEALNLDPKRYWYASKGDEIDAQFTGFLKSHEIPEGVKDPPNPSYDIAEAKKYLCYVFYARFAVVFRETVAKEVNKKQRDLEWTDLNDNSGSHPLMQHFLQQGLEEVYNSWHKESVAMYNEAAAICEEMNWSIYNPEGGLVYKPGRGDMIPGVTIRG
jgi:hypothetical protein